jgi:DNA-3-methyladenine glycosylase II
MTNEPVDRSDIEAALTSADALLGRLIEVVISKIGRIRITSSHSTPFEALTRAIMYQSISGTAGAAIYKKLQSSVQGLLTPDKVLSLQQERLREIGFSKAKAAYAHHLARWFNDNAETAQKLPTLTDDEIISALTTIPGIGVWTANVFLIFNLQRLDVVPANDLGIRRGVQLAYGLEGIASPELVHQKAIRWRPYRSIASMYLWNAVKLKISPEDLRIER